MLRRLDYPPAWLVLFMGAAWVLGRIWSPLGDALVWPGGLVILAGIALLLWAALGFRRARTTIVPREAPSALVDDGPYRFSRNPIYLADLIILAGWVLTTGQPLGLLLVWPFALILTRRFIEPEEAVLIEHLGRSYGDYRRRVRRWF